MLLRLMVAIFCLILALGAVLAYRAGPLVQFALNKAGCEFSAGESSLSYFPTRFIAKDVRFAQGSEATTAIRAEVKVVEAPISLWPLLTGKIRIGKVVLTEPRVEVVEGDGRGSDEPGSPPDLLVEGVEIRGGHFRYRRIYPGKHATITVAEINGGVGELNARSAERTPGRVTAKLEESGKVELDVEAAYFAPSPDVAVDLVIRKQKLADLNSYFVPADGIELFGELEAGHGKVSLRGEKISATVTAKYTAFDVLMRATKQRSKGEAFLANLFRSLQLDDDNLSEPGRDQKHGVKLRRREKESVISALLRGLRESVLHIATT
jgi:hypothetical protein